MTGTTPIYALPYPESSDLVANYPALGQDLAEDLDGILNSKLDIPGAWTGYTPTISGTGWGLGNATLQCRYAQIGKLVVYRNQITFGSTSSFGTDQLSFSAPVTVQGGFPRPAQGVSQYIDVSRAMVFAGTYDTTASQMNFFTLDPISVGGLLTVINTRPFTWAPGDIIRYSGFYEGN